MAGNLVHFLLLGGAAAAAAILPVRLETRSAVTSRLANVHVTFEGTVGGPVTVTYGSCSADASQESHHVLGSLVDGKRDSEHPDRLVWILPEDTDSHGCLSAWSQDGRLVGRSEPQLVQKRERRAASSIPMDNTTGIDVLGPWFEGVVLLRNKQPSPVDVRAAKAKSVAIVGAGMSGLMSFLVLHQAGFKNIKILEAGERLGGRVHTEYLRGGPFNYSYQEMGPMRFPYQYTDTSGTVVNFSDHQLVFQLAAEMNRLNKNDRNLSVDFIPWTQSNSNGLVYHNGFKLPSGLPPTVAQIAANPSLGPPSPVLNNSTRDLVGTVTQFLPPNFQVEIATNMFKAHKNFIENGLRGLGGDSWSEFAFVVNFLKASLNDTDFNNVSADSSFWSTIFEGAYFSASAWRTIDGGLNRLPLSFHPLVDKITHMNRKIERIRYTNTTKTTRPGGRPTVEPKVLLQWRDTREGLRSPLRNETADYALISAPFSVVRSWRLPRQLPAPIGNAIRKLKYDSACKVALEYRERFWEHYANPIYGGCSTTTDIPGIGSICYPSYDFNGTGPATILASYSFNDRWWSSVPEEEHVQYVLDAMTEIHGEQTRQLYTGRYNRRCWELDPLTAAGWAGPTVGQHQLYIPEYHKTYNGLIFIGEHTSYTHAWIASALESGIRGGVQLMLELGLVDEAKATVNKWMARWIDI